MTLSGEGAYVRTLVSWSEWPPPLPAIPTQDLVLHKVSSGPVPALKSPALFGVAPDALAGSSPFGRVSERNVVSDTLFVGRDVTSEMKLSGEGG